MKKTLIILIVVLILCPSTQAKKSKKQKQEKPQTKTVTNLTVEVKWDSDKTMQELRAAVINQLIADAVGSLGLTTNLNRVITDTVTVDGKRFERNSSFATLLTMEQVGYLEDFRQSDVKFETVLSATGFPDLLRGRIHQVKVGLANGQRDPSFWVKLDMDRNEYDHNATVAMTVECSQDAYLMLFTLDLDDIILMYHPGAKCKTLCQHLKKKRPVRLDDGFTAKNDPGENVGERYFYAIALKRAVDPPSGGCDISDGLGVIKYDQGLPFLLKWLGRNLRLDEWTGDHEVIVVKRPKSGYNRIQNVNQ